MYNRSVAPRVFGAGALSIREVPGSVRHTCCRRSLADADDSFLPGDPGNLFW